MNIDRKQQIILTASELFLKEGYATVTMRDLAKELGIKAASLYNHISSKEEILSTIVMGLAEEFTSHIRNVVEKDCSAAEKLTMIIEMHVDITHDKTSFLACMNREWKFLKSGSREHYLELREAYESEFMGIIKKGIHDGEVQIRDEKIFSYSTLSVLRTLYHWYDKEGGFSKKELKQNLIQHILFGITPKQK